VVFLTQGYSGPGPINVGVGTDITIKELAEQMSAVIGYQGDLVFDTSKPDGTPRKLLDVGRLHSLGWRASTALQTGLRTTYAWFCANESQLRR
jgi:GDP-L-fucose synthase